MEEYQVFFEFSAPPSPAESSSPLVWKDYSIEQISSNFSWTRDLDEAETEKAERAFEKPRETAFFCFVIVDGACIKADPPHIILCTDAPDWFENPTNKADFISPYKPHFLPLDEAIMSLQSLELLLIAPNDLKNPKDRVSSVLPEPFWMPTTAERDPGKMFKNPRLATPVEARANKQLALATDPSVRDDRVHTIARIPLGQARDIATAYRQFLDIRWKHARDHFVEESTTLYLGNEMSGHAAHLRYRLAAWPAPLGGTSSPMIIDNAKRDIGAEEFTLLYDASSRYRDAGDQIL